MSHSSLFLLPHNSHRRRPRTAWLLAPVAGLSALAGVLVGGHQPARPLVLTCYRIAAPYRALPVVATAASPALLCEGVLVGRARP